MTNFTCLTRKTLLFLFLIASLQSAFSQQIEKSLMIGGERIGFLEYKPAEYATEGNVKHPLIIFLHGIGERGNGTTELRNVARIALPQMIKNGFPMKFTWNGKTETFLVISPQSPVNHGMWSQNLINSFIKYAIENLRVDPDRIYLTGLSMGGGGTFRYISTAAQNAQAISAAATVCAPCTFDKGEFAANANLPLWATHAADDNIAVSSCTERAVDRINAAGAKAKPIKTIWPTGGHQVWNRLYADTNYAINGIVNVYEWFLGQNRTLPVNKLPIADAGKDQRVAPGTVVKLDGSASRDSDGKVVRYVWKKLSGPSGGTIAVRMGSNPVTTVSGLNTAGTYTFELGIADDRAAISRDTVSVTVAAVTAAPAPKPVDTAKPQTPANPVVVTPAKPVTPAPAAPAPAKPVTPAPANKPPVARTTPDQVIPMDWNYMPKVSGWPSTDEDGWIAKFTWHKVSGPSSYNIVSPNTCETRITGLVAGEYVFRCTAFDNKGASSYADVKITMTQKAPAATKPTPAPPVTPAPVTPKPAPVVPGNKPPVARTTPDQVIPLDWNWFPNVSGWPSTDEDGWIAKFTWHKVSGPNSFKILSPNTCGTKIIDLVEGEYIFRCTAYDNKGASSYADIKITMTKKQAPKAANTAGTSSKSVVEGEEQFAAAPTTVLTMPAEVKLSPNPAVSIVNLTLTSPASGRSFIAVYDISGKLIRQVAFYKNPGVYQHKLDVSQLRPGMYYVNVKTEGELQLQTKLIRK